MNICSRCGSDKQIETHHITHRVNGGGDDPENLKYLCLACHDYQHASDDIQWHIHQNTERNQLARVKIWQYRLYVLEELNKPDLIRYQGYRSWWKDIKTHYMSREVKTFVSPKEQLELINP